jgi:DNA-binding Lrp family transcriptional regulator
MTLFTEKEAAVLDRVQRDFPPGARPYEAMARELSMEEDELLEVIRGLRERRIIRSIAGIFNADRLGYVSALAAFSIDPPSIESAASIVNAHPGVSHNYLRDHIINLWFTLAARDHERLDAYASVLARRSGARDYLLLPVEKMYKIGVHFTVGSEAMGRSSHVRDVPSRSAMAGSHAPLSGDDLEAVRVLQADCPIDPEPFTRLVEREDSYLDGDSVVRIRSELRENGVMRRYSAVIRHHSAGFKANAMTAWRPDFTRPEEEMIGPFRANPAVSHLYLRRTRRGSWDHPLFAMLHARSRDELSGTVGMLARDSGIGDYMVLPTLREFKKERVMYHSRAFEEWETEAGI